MVYPNSAAAGDDLRHASSLSWLALVSWLACLFAPSLVIHPRILKIYPLSRHESVPHWKRPRFRRFGLSCALTTETIEGRFSSELSFRLSDESGTSSGHILKDRLWKVLQKTLKNHEKLGIVP